MRSNPVIGVVIVVYNSADVILDCLESLFSQAGLDPRVVVVDNASPDDSVDRIRAWARGTEPWVAPADSPLGPVPPAPKPVALVERTPAEGALEGLAPLTILHAPRNLGYAGGVNLGLALIAAEKDTELLWILNPDCVVPPETIPALLAHQRVCGPYSIMGGRIVYHANRRIHADGGRVWRWSGVCESVNRGADATATPLPDPSGLDYIVGAHMVVSRAFLEASGPMVEDYFLYYEEVDWAFRRGPLPLTLAPNAIVYHHSGTAIGTAQLGGRPTGFANYFNYRNRMRFVRRFQPWRLPTTYILSLARILKWLPVDDRDRIVGALRGLHGMAPPRFVAERVGPEAAPLAFGPATAA